MTGVAVVAGTELGHALCERLRADGRPVVELDVRANGTTGEALARLRGERLVVVDAEPARLQATAAALGDVLDGNHLVAHMVHGLPEQGPTASRVLHDQTAVRRIGVIAGPLTAADLAAGRPTAAVIASRHPEVVDELSAALSTPRLRLYRSADPVGVELASGMPDLVALGAGVCHALGFGEATRALTVVRIVREIGRLIGALGGDPATASGLAGLGALLVRAFDEAGDVFRYGAALARGPAEPPSGRVAGVAASARGLRALAAQHRVSAHVVAGLAALLSGEVTAADVVTQLMTLPVLDE